MPATCCVNRWNRLMDEDPDMPVFTLLGKDRLAVETVQFWMKRAREEGVNEVKLSKVQEHLDALVAFRESRPERMQLPD